MNSIITTHKMEIDVNSHRSQLPQPKKFTTSSNYLSEVSDSQSNIRCKQNSSPAKSNLKHKMISLHEEPAPKRKITKERTDESKLIAPDMSVGIRSHPKAAAHNRSKSGLIREKLTFNKSHGKSESISDISERNLSRSVGPRSRPAFPQIRPQSSFSQSTITRPVSIVSRAQSLLPTGQRGDDVEIVSSESKREEWDVKGRIKNMEVQFLEMRETIKDASIDKKSLEESMITLKARNTELEANKYQLETSNRMLQSEIDLIRQKAEVSQKQHIDATNTLHEHIRSHQLEIEEIRRQNRHEVEKIRRDNADEIDRLSRENRDQIREIERKSFAENDEKLREFERQNLGILEDEKRKNFREIQTLEAKYASENAKQSLVIQEKTLEMKNLHSELNDIKEKLDLEKFEKAKLQNELLSMREGYQKIINENSSTVQNLEHTLASLRARIHFLESGSKAQSDSFAEMESRLEKALNSARESKEKLVKEESLRRILFNQVQELKGNIRVMCRVRPILNDIEGDAAKFKITDADKESKELEVIGKEEKSFTGNITRKKHYFTFDRVFGPESQNQEVFEEISQLIQSALDGYNVCIFCYGQTGSGKTHTMSSPDGMIPRATKQIYETATNLKEKGWVYNMKGNFVEVYNEEIHDLLTDSKEFDKKKHEIRHDDERKQTIVTGLNTVALDSPSSVEIMLERAAANRSVASTKSNERSSRSHSVFMLKIMGQNTSNNESCEGTLNLVDLAGSERLKQSGAEGDRMKETQSINKSLSCLGDVIGALGQGKGGAHIPYRNSKLTYLLQYSLGGNSKTLMFVMASPLEAHLSETISSLKFATKVHNTHIGTAKKIKK
ncbi:Kinesin-like protein klpA [Erysiphe necator]|uniref:Kinesin-like protein n=1 Tax=Uncinula necator TaxID=52586 RepID=A0A0B1NY28_UNCNE|nr:Kinesin-like protein klpA [Erysiphe necator]KHJ31267.1 putative minus-end-directed microtubule motor [Erysiphe necator]